MRRVSLAGRRARQYLRRPPEPWWVRPALFGAAGILAGGLVGGLAWWLADSAAIERSVAGLETRSLAASRDLGLEVENVFVDGRVRTDREELLGAIGLERGDPVLAVDPDAIRARVEALEWVAQASVERLLPDTVFVHLMERQPLALWQRTGRFALVDSTGAVIGPEVASLKDAAAYGHLRVLVGDDAPAHAARLFATLSTEPGLWARVIAATRVGGRRWTLRLDNEVDVLLPEDGVHAAWRLLAEKQAEERLLERAITLVDLRLLPERIRLRLDPALLQDQSA